MNKDESAYRETPDEALMAAYQAGDMAAFDTLYARYESRIFNHLLRQTGDPETAGDLFQETFLKLHRSRQDYDPERPFSHWIFTIAANLVKTEFKRRRVRAVERAEAEIEGFGGGEPADARAERRESQNRIRIALESLTEAQRQVILLSKYEGISYAEIARITGNTAQAVKQMAYRGLQILREKLKELRQDDL